MEIAPGVLVGGRYSLERMLGEGGMGSVWKGEHVELGRPVAIKLIRAEVAHQVELVARFLREARTAARVRHRNVIDVLDFGQLDDGQPYLVMELLEGESLAARLAREPRPTIVEIVETARGALSGLAAVHDAGIVHRDVKPDNIFLARDADGVVPKLLDFGISKPGTATSALEQPAAALTATGAIVGTAHYLSPEQVQGLKDVDARSDVYAMGAVLYEACTGRPPFDAPSLGALMIAIMCEDPRPISALRSDLPLALTTVIHRALARDREARFPTARAMRDALATAVGADTTGPQRLDLAHAHTAMAMPIAPTPWAVDSAAPIALPVARRGPLFWVALAAIGTTIGAAGAFAVMTASAPSEPLTSPAGDPEIATAQTIAAPRRARLQLDGVPPGATVHLDGVPRDPIDLTLDVDGREHVVRVVAPGRETFERTMRLDADTTLAIVMPEVLPVGIEPPRAVEPRAPEPVASPPRRAHADLHRPEPRHRTPPPDTAPPRPADPLVADPGF